MITFAIRGPIERADLPGLSDRVCVLFAGNRGRIAYCDVAGVAPDAVTVEALARLQLAAHRYACQVRLCNASAELVDLVAWMGLGEALPSASLPAQGSRVEARGESEQREAPRGAEKER
jgi:ABC-type transporter Mla MlaB component